MSLDFNHNLLRLDLDDEPMSCQMASRFAKILVAPLVIGFCGEIGAGKTTFIRAMLRSLGIQGAIKSPTYTLVESYPLKGLLIHHFDLYRIHEDIELEYIGFRDYMTNEAICCIEWPERVQSALDSIDIQFTLTPKGNGRELEMVAITSKGQHILSLFSGVV